MNTTPAEGVELARKIVEQVSGFDRVTIVLCPPATHLDSIARVIKNSPVELGAQNVHWEDKGAFTGELSAAMLLATGCRWAIIGHSERRAFFGETDEGVNRRTRKALESGLRPIVCIGETLEERQSNQTFGVLRRQIDLGLAGLNLNLENRLVIAYEPVWAIGTGLTATPGQAQEAHHFIRNLLSEKFSSEIADKTVIQYGGSVNDTNAHELLTCADVDGALVGGASLKPDKFTVIINAGSEINR